MLVQTPPHVAVFFAIPIDATVSCDATNHYASSHRNSNTCEAQHYSLLLPFWSGDSTRLSHRANKNQRDSHTRQCLPTSASTPSKSLKTHPRAHNSLEQLTPKHHSNVTTSHLIVRNIIPVHQHALLTDNKVRTFLACRALCNASTSNHHRSFPRLNLLEHTLPSPSWYHVFLQTMLILNWTVKP